GACVVALGEAHAAVMGNDQRLIDDLIAAGNECGERLWPMPLDKEYGELIKSEIADVKNVGNRTAGSITAAYFLKHFIGSAAWIAQGMAQQRGAGNGGAANGRFELTIDNIMRGFELVGYEPRAVHWSPDSQRVYFQWKQANEPREKDFDTYVVNRDGSGLKKL